MGTNDHLVSMPLTSIPIFSQTRNDDLARLYPHVKEITLNVGDTIYEAGDQADKTYYIVSGQVKILAGRRLQDTVNAGSFFGEEAALNAKAYAFKAVATEDAVKLMVFSKEGLAEICKKSAMVRADFSESLLNHMTTDHPFEIGRGEATTSVAKETTVKAIGWGLAIVVPCLIYIAGLYAELSWPVINFFTIFSAAVVMWVLRLVPEYVPALFIVMATIVLGLVPNKVVLGGYASGSFFMALSVFGLGAVLVGSGLTYRIALLIMRITPKTGFWFDAAIFGIGFLLTPLLPSANGRAGLMAPLLNEMVNTVGYRRAGIAATQMAAATFAGFSLFSAAFLTSKSVNFALFELFPAQVKDQFTWGYWVFASLVAIVVLLLGYMLLSALFFRHDEKANISSDVIEQQLKILGPMSNMEWVILFGVILFIAGVVTSSLHKIQPPWIGLAILFILLTVGGITKQGFRQQIDWPFLLMLGGFVGLVRTMNYLEIDVLFSQNLAWIAKFMRDDFYIFVLLLCGAMYTIRLVVPNSAAIILVASIFMPVAIQQGINPWIIGFMVLMFSDGWFMTYQCSYYLMFAELSEEKGVFNQAKMLTFNRMSNLLRLAAVYASIPFWKFIGIL